MRDPVLERRERPGRVLQGQGVTGEGSTQECPSTTTTYTLSVVTQSGEQIARALTIEVMGGYNINFYADGYDVGYLGCTTLYWQVEGVSAVYYQGEGVTGQGSRDGVPDQHQPTYTLLAVLRQWGANPRYRDHPRVSTREGEARELTHAAALAALLIALGLLGGRAGSSRRPGRWRVPGAGRRSAGRHRRGLRRAGPQRGLLRPRPGGGHPARRGSGIDLRRARRSRAAGRAEQPAHRRPGRNHPGMGRGRPERAGQPAGHPARPGRDPAPDGRRQPGGRRRGG